MSAGAELRAALQAAMPRGELRAGAALPEFGVCGLTPAWICIPDDVEEVQAVLRLTAAAGAAVVPAGLGLRLGTGRRPDRCDVVLSTRRLRRVLAHEAADMTLVVEAGVTLAEVTAALTPHGQRLPLDPACPARTTIGGLIASDACGPLRAAHGKVRDFVIGVRLVLADGTLVKGGGRVVKNVAGYDLMKLMCGSYGTLGVIVEAAFKLCPHPAQTRIGVLECVDLAAAFAAAAAVQSLEFAPAFARVLDAACAAAVGCTGPTLVIGVEGSEAEVDAQAHAVDVVRPRWLSPEEAAEAYGGARDASLSPAEALCARVSVRSSDLSAVVSSAIVAARACDARAAIVADPGVGSAYVHLSGSTDAMVRAAQELRRHVAGAGGFAVFVAIPAALGESLDPWGEVAALPLMRGIKAALDPAHRLSPGRFIGGI